MDLVTVISAGIFGFEFGEASDILIQTVKFFLENEASNVATVRICSDNQAETSTVCQKLQSVFGASNTSLDLVRQRIHLKAMEPSKYIWQWKDDNRVTWNNYEGLHHAITAKYESGAEEFDSLIDSKKYQSGKRYKINFFKMTQTNVDTGFTRAVQKIANPNYQSEFALFQEDQRVERVERKEKSCLKIRGMKTDLKPCERYLREFIEKNLIKQNFDMKHLQLPRVEEICSPFSVKVESVSKQSVLLIGSESQVSKAEKVLLHELISTVDKVFELPKEWAPQQQNCHLFDVPQGSQEWQVVEKRFRETMPNNILKIERIQSKTLWKKYSTFKSLQIDNNGKEKEMMLFHGTRETRPSEIYTHGFDMRFCSSGMWGRVCLPFNFLSFSLLLFLYSKFKGSYFAVNASYSHSYRYTNGPVFQMFLASVLVGDSHFCPSDSSITVPPFKPNTGNTLRYDSVSGITGGSTVFIVYENGLAYPSYLISYQ